jgi:predicted transcriptional regulator
MGLIRLGNKPPLTVAPEDTVVRAARAMTERRVGAATVLEGTGVVGVVTERDVMEKVVAAGGDPNTTRSYFKQVIARSKQRGTDAAVLGCTETPLLMGDTASPLPTLDSARILARAALREAVREEAPNARLERTG